MSQEKATPKEAVKVDVLSGGIDKSGGIIRVRAGPGARGQAVYRFDKYPCEDARACYYVRKLVEGSGVATRLGEGDYYVLLDCHGVQGMDRCECWGFTRWGHCRHVGAMRSVEEMT